MSEASKAAASVTRGTVGERIRVSRRACGLSQEALAARLGVRRSAVTQWERTGGTVPSVLNMLQAAVELRVSLEWLATGRGHRHLPIEDASAFSVDCIARGSDEEELLKRYRALTFRQKDALIVFLRESASRSR